jgi:hypothetical protein
LCIRTWRERATEKETRPIQIQNQALPIVPREWHLLVRRQVLVHPLQRHRRAHGRTERNPQRFDRDHIQSLLPPNSEREHRVHQAEADQLPEPIPKRVQPGVQRRGQETPDFRVDHLGQNGS